MWVPGSGIITIQVKDVRALKLGGLVVKMLIFCCTGDLEFDPWHGWRASIVRVGPSSAKCQLDVIQMMH